MTSILLETGEPSPVQVSSESSETPTRRYATLLAAVRTRGWDAAGMGDDDLRLEEFVLCRDGRYHRRDAFGYKVPECTLQLVRPAATRSESPAGDTEAAEAAEAATAKAKARAKAAVRMVVPRGAGASIHQMDSLSCATPAGETAAGYVGVGGGGAQRGGQGVHLECAWLGCAQVRGV